MNKLIMINIIFKLFEKFLLNELDYQTMSDIIHNEKDFDYSDNRVTSTENFFLIFLFTNVPYYKIHDTLNSFLSYIKTISKEDHHLYTIARLAESYIEDLSGTINERIRTELHYQLLYLFNNYYNNSIDKDKNTSVLLKNICDPRELFHKDYLDDSKYEQLSFLDVDIPIDLREEVSKKHYNKKSYTEKRVVGTFSSCLNKEQVNEFVFILNELLEGAKDISDNDIYNLLKIYNVELSYLYKKINDRIDKTISNDTVVRYMLQNSIA